LQHPLNLSFASRTKATFAGMVSADVGFIDFNFTAKRKLAVNVRHMLPDESRHPPRCLVGHSKLAFKFFGRNSVTGCCEKVNGVEPQLQRSPRVLKWSSGGGVDMVPAPLTGKSPFRLEAIPASPFCAFWADVALSVAGFKDVFEAFFVCGKRSHEVANRNAWFFFVNNLSFHWRKYSKQFTLCQGDNSVKLWDTFNRLAPAPHPSEMKAQSKSVKVDKGSRTIQAKRAKQT